MKIGEIEIYWLGHAAFKIKADKKVIYIDPFQISGLLEKADIIFLTHPHYDHCSLEDLQKIVKDGTKIIMHADCQSKVARLQNKIGMVLAKIGDKFRVDSLEVSTVAAYNTKEERQKFHAKHQEWLGYILRVNGKAIYHTGDTDMIPEMERIGKTDIVLLPVSGTYVMTAEEAAEAAKKIKPELAIPMHYGSIAGNEADADKFVSLCEKAGIKAEKLRRE